MKREGIKYVVLGIGLGFLMAAGLFLKFGGREKEVLSEREIVERARGLGMVFLTEGTGQPAEKSAEESRPAEVKQQEDKSAEEGLSVKPSTESSAAEAKSVVEEVAEKKPEPVKAADDVKADTEPKSEAADGQSTGSEKPAPVTKPAEIAPPKQPSKPQTTPVKPATDVVTEIISGDDPAAKDLLPPNSNRPKSTETLPTNHF